MAKPMSADELRLLTACVACEDGKGIPVAREWVKAAKSLTRRGHAWMLESVFCVCIATEAGRRALAHATTAKGD